MKNLLLDRNFSRLEKMLVRLDSGTADGIHWIFDYDGTLAPIVTDPLKAVMRARTRELFRRFTATFPTSVVSGRARAQVAGFMKGIQLRYIVGNHGMEWGQDQSELRRFHRRVLKWRKPLEQGLAGWEGIEIEEKNLSFSVHFRCSPRKAEALERILRVARGLEGVRTVGGKYVVNLVHRESMNKGDAVKKIRELSGAKAVVFIGDDITDEDALKLRPVERYFGIRIGRWLGSRAEYFLPNQSAIDDWMTRTLHARERLKRRYPALRRSSGVSSGTQ